MPTLRLSNGQEWKGIVADKEARACLRKIVLSILSDLDPRRVAAYRITVEASRGVLRKKQGRVSAIDSEVGCIVSLLERLPDSGESKEFRRMMEEKRTALLKERGEVLIELEKVPMMIEGAERILREIEGQVANAEFLMKVIDEVDHAEGGVPGVADEPRGPCDNGPASDAPRNV
jgi:hypothetical protein